MNKILRKIRKIFYLNQIKPGPRFGRLRLLLSFVDHSLCAFWIYAAKIIIIYIRYAIRSNMTAYG